MALNGVLCADVPLRNCSLIHSLTHWILVWVMCQCQAAKTCVCISSTWNAVRTGRASTRWPDTRTRSSTCPSPTTRVFWRPVTPAERSSSGNGNCDPATCLPRDVYSAVLSVKAAA